MIIICKKKKKKTKKKERKKNKKENLVYKAPTITGFWGWLDVYNIIPACEEAGSMFRTYDI